MFTCEIDTDNLILGLDSYRDALLGQGKDASTLVQDETKFLARTIAAFMPPIARRGATARAIGEQAVKRDIENLASEATQELIDNVGSKYGITNINTFETSPKTGILINLQWDHLDPTGARLAEYHRQYLNSEGRIPKAKSPEDIWKSRVVVPVGTRAPFIAAMQKHVGHLKATWAKAGAVLGDTYPRWIATHFGSSLAVVNKDGLNNLQAPSVTFGSRAGGNRRLTKEIQKAVKARVKALAGKTRLLLSGYDKDLAKGMKARATARRHREQLPPIE